MFRNKALWRNNCAGIALPCRAIIFDDRSARLGASGATVATVVLDDALRFLDRPAAERFDVVFLDPPFAADVLPEVLRKLACGWLAPNALIYVECPADAPLPALPQGWSAHRTKRAGQVGYHLLRAA